MLARLSLATTSVCMTSCAWTSKWLASEPSAHFSNAGALQLPASVSSYVNLHCMAVEKIKYYEKTDSTGAKPRGTEACIYVSAEANNLFAAKLDPADLSALVESLVTISDMNCSNFLSRAFANRAAGDFTKTLIQDLATAGAAGTSWISAGVSSGLSGTNLLVGKTVDTFEGTYFANQAFDAMQSAISAERADLRKSITTKETNNSKTGDGHQDYLLQDAMSDIRGYDDACSIRQGLAKLAALANDAKSQAQGTKPTGVTTQPAQPPPAQTNLDKAAAPAATPPK